MSKKRQQFLGLHLWSVKVGNENLWIVTRNRSPEEVARKARSVIRREFYRGKIEKIENCGTIDK